MIQRQPVLKTTVFRPPPLLSVVKPCSSGFWTVRKYGSPPPCSSQPTCPTISLVLYYSIVVLPSNVEFLPLSCHVYFAYQTISVPPASPKKKYSRPRRRGRKGIEPLPDSSCHFQGDSADLGPQVTSQGPGVFGEYMRLLFCGVNCTG